MKVDNALADLESYGFQDVVTLAGEGWNTEISYCYGSLTLL